jgi:hypothetical protein
MKLTYLSHNHYMISDANAGRLAKASPGNAGKLPRVGYERDIILPDGRRATLSRTQQSLLDPVPKRARGWVWTVRPINPLPAWVGSVVKQDAQFTAGV